MKVFFVQYNDPIYVQVEKIESMIMLASNENIDLVLNELTETTEKVDLQLIKMAIRAIARCAIKLEKSADKCVKILVDLISNSQEFAIAQEGISVLKGEPYFPSIGFNADETFIVDILANSSPRQ